MLKRAGLGILFVLAMGVSSLTAGETTKGTYTTDPAFDGGCSHGKHGKQASKPATS